MFMRSRIPKGPTDRTSEQLQADYEAFLANGGVPQEIPFGVSALAVGADGIIISRVTGKAASRAVKGMESPKKQETRLGTQFVEVEGRLLSPRNAKAYARYSKAIRDEWEAMYLAGASRKTIATKYGCAEATVYAELRYRNAPLAKELKAAGQKREYRRKEKPKND